MLESYRRIFTPVTARFSATALVARLPISMMGLGLVLLAEHETGSYGFAGAVSAVALLAQALFAIPQGRLIDRFGQGPVLSAVITVWGVALALTVGSLSWDWPTWLTFVLAAATGASLPSVGTCVRARWSAVLANRPADLHTAFSLEAVADEAVFLTGPIAVTILSTAVHPVAGLATALAAGVVGTWVYALQRATQPPLHPRILERRERPPIPWRSIAPLTLVSAALGILFGAAEVVTVAFADEQGHKSMAGFLLATWSLGSLAAGVVSGAIVWKRGPLVRLRFGAAGMALTMLPMPFVPSLPIAAAVLLVGGVAIAPTLIAAMSLAEQVLPPQRLTEGMAFVHTGLAAGLAPGAALAGVIIDDHGASAAYGVCVAGGVLTLVAALLTRVSPRAASVPSHDPRSPHDNQLA